MTEAAVSGQAICAITAPLAEGWAYKESITLLEPEGLANVIASSEPIPAGMDARQYADAQGGLLNTEFPGYRELSLDAGPVFGGLEGFTRIFEWTPEQGQPVTQIQVYAVADGRGLVATATAPTVEFSRFELTLARVLQGITFGR